MSDRLDPVAEPVDLGAIEALFAARGGEQYTGEPVTHLEHALQCATLAERAGADDALVTAALLHDVGHLLRDHGPTPSLRGVDDRHELAALPWLGALFGASVLEPVRWHVDAKRYLCATQPGYRDRLSEDSERSLALQGGVFSAEEAAAFMARPGARDAVRLRVWDDLAKQPGATTPTLAHFMQRAARCVR